MGIFSALVIGSGTVIPAYAGITDSAILEVSPPTTVKGKDMTTIYGGGIHWRIKDETFRPFNVIPPSIRSGCGGLDATFGAFSYFNMEYLGQFLQNVLSAAPVIAFDLALHTLCSQCEELLKNLTALANQINQISASKCGSIAMATQLGHWLVDSFMGRPGEGSAGSSFADNFKFLNDFAKDINSVVQQGQQLLNQWCPAGNCLAGLMFNTSQNPFSLVEMAVKEMPQTQKNLLGLDDLTLAALLRTYTGDVGIIPPRSDGEKKNDLVFSYWKNTKSADSFIREVLGIYNDGTEVSCVEQTVNYDNADLVDFNSASCNAYAGDGNISCFVPSNVSLSIHSLCGEIKQYTDQIKNKILQRQPLSDTEMMIMASMPAPVLTLVNVGSVDPALLDVIFQKINIYMSAELGSALLRAMTRSIAKWASACISEPNLNKEKRDICMAFQNNVGEIARDTYSASVQYQKELAEAIQTANVAYNLYARILAQMSNSNLYGNLMYSKMLGVVR